VSGDDIHVLQDIRAVGDICRSSKETQRTAYIFFSLRVRRE